MTDSSDADGARGRVVRVAVAIVLLAVAVGWVALRRAERARASAGRGPAQIVALVAPRGNVASAPELFHWKPVPGASRYRVQIADADAVWPLFVRTTTSPALGLEPHELPALTPGRVHEWGVEAFDDAGTLIASGGTQFRVRAPGDAAAP